MPRPYCALCLATVAAVAATFQAYVAADAEAVARMATLPLDRLTHTLFSVQFDHAATGALGWICAGAVAIASLRGLGFYDDLARGGFGHWLSVLAVTVGLLLPAGAAVGVVRSVVDRREVQEPRIRALQAELVEANARLRAELGQARTGAWRAELEARLLREDLERARDRVRATYRPLGGQATLRQLRAGQSGS